MKSVDQYPDAYRSFVDTEDSGPLNLLVCTTCGAGVPERSAGTHKEWHDNLHYAVQTLAELDRTAQLLAYTSML
jgi:hypothetical protein